MRWFIPIHVRSGCFTANNIRDVHDIISIAVDGNGFLHMSWGMHNDAFHYARTLAPATGDGPIVFGPDGKTTGQEDRVCYPEFFHLPDGDLLYMFREGGSGDGDNYLSRYDLPAATWKPVHAVAVLEWDAMTRPAVGK